MYTPQTKGKEKFIKARKILEEEGVKSLFVKLFLFFIYSPIRNILLFFSSVVIFFKPKGFFSFQGKRLPYFYNRYNTTWKNERVIEVPIIIEYLKKFSSKRILEFGAVLTHYYPIRWDVIDKYERGKSIINEDVINFKPINKYDLIVSISTLEHVGFDEKIQDPLKISKSIKNLKENCLNNGGKGVITMPIGYNPNMDEFLFSNKLGFDEKIFLKRINKKNEWKEVSEEKVRGTKYNFPFNAANAIVIGIIQSKE